MPQGIGPAVPNNVILSADINAGWDRVVGRYATSAGRDAAIPTPVPGHVCYRADRPGLEVYHGGQWQPMVATRCGCHLTVAGGQSIPAGGTAAINWTAELYDTDNFHAANASTVVIPAGMGGVYAVHAFLAAGGTLNGQSSYSIMAGATRYAVSFIPASQGEGSVGVAAVEATAGAAFSLSVFNGHSGAVSGWNGRLVLARLSL